MMILVEKPLFEKPYNISLDNIEVVPCKNEKDLLLAWKDIMKEVDKKEQLFRTHLKHPKIKEIRGKGLMLAIEFNDEELSKKVVEQSLEKGLI